MSPDLSSVFVVLALLVLGGLLAMGEVAVISASRQRLRRLAEKGDRRAARVLEMAAAPNRFLSAMLVGVTLLTLVAGFIAAVRFGPPLAALLARVPGLATVAGLVGYAVALVVTTIVSLALSDFLPQRLAVINPDRVALALGRPLWLAYRLGAPVAALVTVPLDRVLGAFGVRPGEDARVSDEDIKTLVERGLRSGSIQKAERDMVEGVLNLDALPVTAIMTPRPKIVWLNAEDPEEVNWRKIVTSGHSHFPVYQGNYDHVLGMVAVKALWANQAIGLRTPLKDLITPAVMVPEKMVGIQLLEAFKKAGRHTALVVDEFGSVQGMVTLIDVLEAIVGDLPSLGSRQAPEARQREDGSWLIDATMPVGEVKDLLHLEELPHQDADYQTLGGLVLTALGRIPQAGDHFDWAGFRFEVVDMDRNRIDKVLVAKRAVSAPAVDTDAA